LNLQNNKDITVKDFLVSGESFTLKYDAEKQMLITTPQPSAASLPSYYESEDYISHTDDTNGVLAFLYQRVKTYSLKRKVRLISKLNKGEGSLLDIGAGTGDFLNVAKENHWTVLGVEVNEQARVLAQNKGISLKEDMDLLGDTKYDVITLWHVLEHIPNIEETCQKLEFHLKENGHLVIAVPNYKSYDAHYYKEFWAAYDVPRHLWHFSQASMKKLFSSKMNLIKTRPLVFDSYYVSLLSEKYRTSKKLSLKALWVGFKSNRKAKQTSEYSSLIYCFKKGF
jgi:2-polyprenyl-3-methyl-5-hydroxy-6-metoxy-1,4-benzoquinol methylase